MSEHKEFYDNSDIRAKYIARRTQPDNPNDTLERPIFLDLVGSLDQLDIIDLGCGDVSFGKESLVQGARSYTGIEASRAMVDLALAMLTNTSGKVQHERLEAWKAQSEATVQQFYQAGLAAGGQDNGAPGERHYHPGYYAAFLLDPEGNNIEAVYHGVAERSVASVVITTPGPLSS